MADPGGLEPEREQRAEALPNQDLLERFYPDGAPIIVQVAFKYGYGAAFIELNRKVYFHPGLSFGDDIREAIQAIVLAVCENKYCLVMHLRGLITTGWSQPEVAEFITHQRLPESVEQRERWEPTLRRLAGLCREPRLAPRLYESLREFHEPAVLDEIGGVVAFSLLHKLLLELYSDEILIEQEPILFRTVDCAEELIRDVMREGEREVPLYTLCCVCKDIKAETGWSPVERALGVIPAESVFSHGYCPRCYPINLRP